MEYLAVFWPVLIFLAAGLTLRLVPEDYAIRHNREPNRPVQGVRLNLGFDLTPKGWQAVRRRGPLLGLCAGAAYAAACAACIWLFHMADRGEVMRWTALCCLLLFFGLVALTAKRDG